MALTKIGDLVRLIANIRLDLVDILAMQTLNYETISNVIGTIYGESSGAVGAVTFGTTPLSAITIGECMLIGSKRVSGSSGRCEGIAIHYNPASPYQSGSTTVDISAYSAVGYPYLWFARTEMQADMANRRSYDSGAGREVTISPNTRWRQKVIFGATSTRDTPPDAEQDWYVFAQVTAWAGIVPTIETIDPYDVGIVPRTDPYATSYLGKLLRRTVGTSYAGYKMGLPYRLNMLAQKLTSVISNDWAFGEDQTLTTAGTVGLAGEADPGINQLSADMESVAIQPVMLAWGKVTTTATVTDFSEVTKRDVATDASSRSSAGVYLIGIRAPSGIVSVNVTIKSKDSPAIDVPAQAATVVTRVNNGTGAGDFIIVVWTYDKGNAGTDADPALADIDFYITVWGHLEA